MIRIAPLSPYEPKVMERLQKLLYAAFGVGCENVGELTLPSGHHAPFDAQKLLQELSGVRAYADDKVLFVTNEKLKERSLPSGKAPTSGYCVYDGDRALISTADVKNHEEDARLIGRNAMHQLGHLWELHHCLDPRCAMYPQWTPSSQTGEPVFCNFCRDKSEQKIRLAKS